ncbi:MAG: SRPBCC family protein [Deltaproteobacteria bacterium]|nr:SRPBCC family protein [Deltaproteobacteria bacterium]
MKNHVLVASLALCWPLSVAVAAGPDDKLAAGEILVSTRDVGADLPEATVQAVIDAPPATVWKIVDDCANYKKTMPRIVDSKVHSRNGSVAVCEVKFDMPAPFSDLVSVTEATSTAGPPQWKRVWKFLRGDYKRNEGSWTLSAFDAEGKRTRAVYRVLAIPNSTIPNFMIRKAQEGALPDVMKRVRRAVAGQ